MEEKDKLTTEPGMERYGSPEIPYKIISGMMVHLKNGGEMGGVSGKHMGTVDHMEGDDYIKLACKDSFDGKHHWIPLSWVKSVEEKAIHLNVSEREFYEGLIDESPYGREAV